MLWSHDVEVSTVEGRDGGDPESFGHRDHAGVDDAEAEIDAGVDQLDDPSPVIVEQVDASKLAGVDRMQEPGFGCGTQPRLDQPARLDDDWVGTSSSPKSASSTSTQSLWRGSSLSATP